jgi:3'-5' exoribonuclease
MKSPNVGDLVPNDVVTAQFLVLSKEIRQKKTGEPYLTLHLADRTGELEAKMWDNVAEVMNTFERDDFVKVKGLVQVYQNRSQFTVHRLRRIQDHEVDLADYFPSSERDPEEMFGELRAIIAATANPHLRGLLEAIFADEQLVRVYKMAPAAKNIHHAWRSGLLEHVLSLCALGRMVGPHYKEVDVDLLTAGAILHDIGKIDELTYARSFGYSADGQLLGHILLGLRLLNRHLEKLPDFPPKLRTLLEHMIASHHGELAFGSPKTPMFAEALLLHHLDNLDSKMEAARSALKRDQNIEGDFTGWISALERVLLKKEQYLNPVAPPVPVPVTFPAHSAVPAASATVPPTAPQTESPAPKPPAPPAAARPKERAQPVHTQPAHPTLFGEKLQAVLNSED